MAVYLVSREGAPKGEKPHMVEARTRVAAIAHVARNTFGAVPLSLKEAINWTKEGIELEEANAEEAEPASGGEASEGDPPSA